MPRRNFILFVIVTAVIVLIGLWYFASIKPSSNGGEVEEESGFLSDFNPFGKSKNVTPSPTPEATNPEPTPTPEAVPAGKLQKVSSMPVAGYTVYQKERYKEVLPPPIIETSTEIPVTTKKVAKPTPPPTEFVPALRYVARSNGNIYQTFADKIEERKFSGTVVPKVYEAFFTNKGEGVVMRYLRGDDQTIQTFVGTLPKELLGADSTEDNEVKGSFLPENITDLSISPDTMKMFYLLPSGDGVVGITAGGTGDKKAQVFDSPFTEWLPSWPGTSLVTLTTKPAQGVPGYMYMLDLNKKTFVKTLGDINGLTTLSSPNGKLALYANDNLGLGVFEISTKSNVNFGLRTLPEKCVWTKGNDSAYCAVPQFVPQGSYPDSWYKGEVTFTDQIWKIDMETGNTTMVLGGVEITGGLDGVKLSLDASEGYLFFVNRKDSSLWELNLK